MSAYIKDIIYGGNDGILSVFSGGTCMFRVYYFSKRRHDTVAAAAGTGNATKVYSSLVLGVAKWFAGAVRKIVRMPSSYFGFSFLFF